MISCFSGKTQDVPTLHLHGFVVGDSWQGRVTAPSLDRASLGAQPRLCVHRRGAELWNPERGFCEAGSNVTPESMRGRDALWSPRCQPKPSQMCPFLPCLGLLACARHRHKPGSALHPPFRIPCHPLSRRVPPPDPRTPRPEPQGEGPQHPAGWEESHTAGA